MHACPTCGAKSGELCYSRTFSRRKTRHCSARVAAARADQIALITEICSSHPTAGETHECMADEMRCAYCGTRLAPYPCHACGKFLTAKRMHEAASAEMPHHCTECLP